MSVLAPEKIPVSPHGTWEKPVLERIAPGQNYKDMRTWVFYLSIHGKLFKAVVEKILHEKKTAYLTCSNAKKKALQDKCKWRGRLYMRGKGLLSSKVEARKFSTQLRKCLKVSG